MPQEHERGLGGWQAEWDVLPELVMLAGGSARASAEALEGLEIDTPRMRANLDRTRGIALSEAVAQHLVGSLGRAAAHTRVAAACEAAQHGQRELLDVLREDAQISAAIAPHEFEALLDPAQQLGAAQHFIERALERWAREEASRA